MKYESAILKRLIDTYGVVGNPHYISEIIKEFIVQGKECYPDLFTYQSDWLAHIDEFGLNPSYTVSYTGQSIYAPNTLERPVKRAILKGSTKYRDIDTGEFLETFEEGRNLELVSVKMPVLKTLNNQSNLFFTQTLTNFRSWRCISFDTFIKAEIYVKADDTVSDTLRLNVVQNINGANKENIYTNDSIKKGVNVEVENVRFIGFHDGPNGIEDNGNGNLLELIKSGKLEIIVSDKTNILTVNEDVTLRSNGDICDELNLLTGQLTQRIGEDGVVLSQEVVKTVDLSILDQNGQNVKQLMSFKGGTHFNTRCSEGTPLPLVSVSVETDLEEVLMVCSLDGNTL